MTYDKRNYIRVDFGVVGVAQTGRLFDSEAREVGSDLYTKHRGSSVRIGKILKRVPTVENAYDVPCSCGSHDRAFKAGAYKEELLREGFTLDENFSTNTRDSSRPDVDFMIDDYNMEHVDEYEEGVSEPIGVVYDAGQVSPLLQVTYKYCTCEEYKSMQGVVGSYVYTIDIQGLTNEAMDALSFTSGFSVHYLRSTYIDEGDFTIRVTSKEIQAAEFHDLEGLRKLSDFTETLKDSGPHECIFSTSAGIMTGHLLELCGPDANLKADVGFKGCDGRNYVVRTYPFYVKLLPPKEGVRNKKGDI